MDAAAREGALLPAASAAHSATPARRAPAGGGDDSLDAAAAARAAPRRRTEQQQQQQQPPAALPVLDGAGDHAAMQVDDVAAGSAGACALALCCARSLRARASTHGPFFFS
jgi:hypothetical protein